jgi:serine/threonine protein kinase
MTVSLFYGCPMSQDYTQNAETGRSIQTLPTQLDRYTLYRRLGVGGMAEVFWAKQDGVAGFEKTVVIKRLLPHLAQNQRFIEMFLREARIASALSHPNVVQIYELGQNANEFYIAMEYVDGLTLRGVTRSVWAQKNSMRWDIATKWIGDAALGLDYVHRATDEQGASLGLIHRDISPDNLIVGRIGLCKVLDFGIAKPLADGEPMTQTGELKGKVPYMSPEQVNGLDLDGRTDIYALGISLYWMLTQSRPFDRASDLLTLTAILTDEPTPPRELNPEIPEGLEQVILKLIRKDREKRYSNGTEAFQALQPFFPKEHGATAEYLKTILELPENKIAEFTPVKDSTNPTASRAGFQQPTLQNHPHPSTPVLTPTMEVITQSATSEFQKPAVAAKVFSGVLAGSLMVIIVGALAYFLLFASGEKSNLPPGQQIALNGQGAPLPAPAPTRPPAVADDKPAEPITPPATAETPKPTVKSTKRSNKGKQKDSRLSSSKRKKEPKVAKQDKTVSPPSDSPKTASPKTSTQDAPAIQIQLKARRGIQWKTESGKVLGTGSKTVSLAASPSTLIAYDTYRKIKSRVRVVNQKADYRALKKGKMIFRVSPYAEVFFGKESLGTTPFAPIETIEGTYRVRMVYEGQAKNQSVEIKPGETTRVKAIFSQ